MTATFRHPECGGTVRPFAGPGRRQRHRYIWLPVPSDLAISTCSNCGEEFIDPADAQRIDNIMGDVYRSEMKGRIAAAFSAIAAAKVEQSAVEVALGLSTGYLSKVKQGARDPSADLVSQLALLAKDPRKRVNELLKYWGAPVELKAKRGPKPKRAGQKTPAPRSAHGGRRARS